MPLVEFIPAKLNQWVSYKNNEHLIWIAGDNILDKYNYLIKKITTNKHLNKDYVKNIIKGIDDYFGIVVITKKLKHT